jgi:hypothetical protein
VSSGAAVETLTLLGQYTAANFQHDLEWRRRYAHHRSAGVELGDTEAVGRAPLISAQRELGISEQDVIKNVMLKETVDGEFTTVEDVSEAALFFAAFNSNALTGQSLIVSHGWFME